VKKDLELRRRCVHDEQNNFYLTSLKVAAAKKQRVVASNARIESPSQLKLQDILRKKNFAASASHRHPLMMEVDEVSYYDELGAQLLVDRNNNQSQLTLDQPSLPQSTSDERLASTGGDDIEMQDLARSMPPIPGRNGSTTKNSVTIPIRGEEGSLEAMLRELLKENVGSKSAKPRKSRIGQAIQKEKEEDTTAIRNAYLVSYVLCRLLQKLTSPIVSCPRTYQKFFWHRTRLRHHHKRQRGLCSSRGVQ
jgi:hypothetical protein